MSMSTATSAPRSSSVIRSAVAVPCPDVSSISSVILCVRGLRDGCRLRVIGAVSTTPDQRRDLFSDANRRPADQLPGTGDPDQETDHDQDRDRVHGPGGVRVDEAIYFLRPPRP